MSHIRSYPWSSYASYLGLRACPPWLETVGILSKFEDDAGGRRHAGYKKFVEKPIRQGTESTIVDRPLTGLAIGSPEFVAKVYALAKGDSRSVELLHARQNQGRMGADQTGGERGEGRVVGIICRTAWRYRKRSGVAGWSSFWMFHASGAWRIRRHYLCSRCSERGADRASSPEEQTDCECSIQVLSGNSECESETDAAGAALVTVPIPISVGAGSGLGPRCRAEAINSFSLGLCPV